jgi:N-acetylneuraminic acid mutarotase
MRETSRQEAVIDLIVWSRYAFHLGWFDTGSMNVPRFDLVSCLLTNGKVLVIGGSLDDGVRRRNGSNDVTVQDSTELYDPSTGNWTMSGTMHFPRTQHAASVLPNGKVLVIGGVSNWEPAIQTAELYNPSIGT